MDISRAAITPKTVSYTIGQTWLQRATPYLLIAPTMVFVFLFTIWPALQAIIASLQQPGRRGNPDTFVGLQNYADLFDPNHFIGRDFTIVLSNTLFFALATVIFCVPLALLFALLLNRKIKGLGIWRFGIFYPALLPLIGAASLWAFIFADEIGVAYAIFNSLGLANPKWLNADLALISVTLVNIWKQSSYYMIFYLAGLQAIPRDIYEAADIEGASGLQQLWFITIPLLKRTTLFILVVCFTFAFQTVEHLAALGGGGPGVRSNLLLYYIFQKIPERLNWGYVNAMTVILVIIVLSFTVANLLFFERGGREDER